MKDLRIVIPALDEEEGIGNVIERVKKSCPDAEIIVVDDGSTDRTADIAKGLGVGVISNTAKHGKGGATKAGFRREPHDTINYLGFIDGDDTYMPEKFPEMYRLCKDNQADMVIASRFLGTNQGMPPIRKLGNQIFSIMLSFYTRKRTTDTSTGQRILNIELLPAVEILPDGLDFDTAMTAYVLFEGLSYREVPIEHDERRGHSKLNIVKDGYRFIKVILLATKKYRPLVFYLTLGIPFTIFEFILNLFRSAK